MAVPDRMDERLRALRLVEEQRMAQAVFAEGGLISPGSTECEVDDRIWDVAGEAFLGRDGITGRQLHAEVRALAGKAGWSLGAWQVGRLCGQAPAVGGSDPAPRSFIGPDNDEPLRRTDAGGWRDRWILEIRLVDEYGGFGGAFKQLLDLV
ncbi:hypothetical protein ACE1OC_34740 [Streptomyces sp. DSM 116496]|uniref:hypothetical protein n=1 Tax=Streptomyces stoeckheimensis TaxID=3344656 RepID=UPI0038B359A6